MNFNIYLDDETGQQLLDAADQAGETRNAVIRKAVSDWLARHGQSGWPDAVITFAGAPDLPAFENARQTLTAPTSDPLA